MTLYLCFCFHLGVEGGSFQFWVQEKKEVYEGLESCLLGISSMSVSSSCTFCVWRCLSDPSANSFSSLGLILSGPIDLCMFNDVLCHQPFHLGLFSLSSSSAGWVPWEQLVLLIKTEAKALSSSAFFSSLSIMFPSCMPWRVELLHSPPFVICIFMKPF